MKWKVQIQKLGHFKIEEVIGHGAMGIVYRAVDENDGSLVALKVFHADPQLTETQKADLLRRFEKEANILKEIQQENIVGYREFGQIDDKQYLAMEYLEGQNIKDLLEMNVSFDLEEVADIGLQVLSGLAACHERGIIHRDIKPANIVKLPNGIVKLTDFGIARILTDATISKTGMVVGTPNYMSPEQIRGDELTPASDLFSLGIVLYELLTRRKPFDADTIATIMYNVLNVEPPPPSFYNPSLPASIDSLICKAISKRVETRYQSARDFQKDLMAVIQELPIAAPESAQLSKKIQPPAPNKRVIYCIDCGTPNPTDRMTCLKCKLPLIKREMIEAARLPAVPRMPPEARLDRAILLFLNTLLAAIILFIIYLFFRS